MSIFNYWFQCFTIRSQNPTIPLYMYMHKLYTQLLCCPHICRPISMQPPQPYSSLLQHSLQLSTLLQEYITNICSCGHITVNVTVTSCTGQTVMYSVQLTGAMATKVALLLITIIQQLLDRRTGPWYCHTVPTEDFYDNQKIAVQTEILAVIVTLRKYNYSNTVTLLLLLLTSVLYFR